MFTYDLPNCFPHLGTLFNGIYMTYLMFADDLCIIAETPAELQSAINGLENYCKINALNINTSKTKCMAFYRGRPPTCSFKLGEANLEIVNAFTYLGFYLTGNTLQSVPCTLLRNCPSQNTLTILPLKQTADAAHSCLVSHSGVYRLTW